MGELAHASVPDLKETEGGLRDATVLKALVATWLVDVPHVELERSRLALLDMRDLVHGLAGRATDRVTPEMWSDLAPLLGVADSRAAQVAVRELGRRIAHLSRLTWRRVDDALDRATSARRPSLVPVAEGVALAAGEIVLDKRARPAEDPALLLRAAAAAAERDVVLAPPTAARLARECAPLPTPWPSEARDLLVRLLASGRGLLGTWETLEETGALSGILPEWERIRLLPHASEIHRFTVDRHVVETCMEASSMIRRVDRPDVLMVAALLHDIGKGSLTEHSVAGEPVAREIATRMGFDAEGVDLIAQLVRWHLLLAETATTRDPDDPATVQAVAGKVRTRQALDLLTVLTEADARAASPKAWSSWRAGLILDLSRRTAAALCHRCSAAAGDVRGGHRSRRRRATASSSPSRTSTTAAGSRRSPRTGSGCSPTSRPSSPCSGSGSAAPGRGTRTASASRSGRSPSPASSPRRCARRTTGSSRAGSTRLPAAAVRRRRCCRPRSTSARRRPTHATVLEVRTTDRPGVVHLVCAALARARRDRALGARRHARTAGGRRVLPAGVVGRRAQRPAGGGGGPRGAGGADGGFLQPDGHPDRVDGHRPVVVLRRPA